MPLRNFLTIPQGCSAYPFHWGRAACVSSVGIGSEGTALHSNDLRGFAGRYKFIKVSHCFLLSAGIFRSSAPSRVTCPQDQSGHCGQPLTRTHRGSADSQCKDPRQEITKTAGGQI